MKTVDELKSYFESELTPDIKSLEKRRKAILSKAITVAVVAAVAFVLWISFVLTSDINPGFLLLGMLIIPILGYVFYREITGNTSFYKAFKLKVINRIVHFINDSFVYDPRKHIPPVLFAESKIFADLPNKYDGDDFVVGALGEHIQVEFSEVVAQKKQRKGGKDSKKADVKTIFKGLFLVAQIKDHDFGSGFILPKGMHFDATERGFPADAYHKVESNNGQFNQYFDVYGQDVERVINRLDNDGVANLLVTYKETYKNKVYYSFQGNRVYVGVAFEKDLFEPNIYKSMLDFGMVKEYYDVLYNALTVMETIASVRQADQVAN